MWDRKKVCTTKRSLSCDRNFGRLFLRSTFIPFSNIRFGDDGSIFVILIISSWGIKKMGGFTAHNVLSLFWRKNSLFLQNKMQNRKRERDLLKQMFVWIRDRVITLAFVAIRYSFNRGFKHAEIKVVLVIHSLFISTFAFIENWPFLETSSNYSCTWSFHLQIRFMCADFSVLSLEYNKGNL